VTSHKYRLGGVIQIAKRTGFLLAEEARQMLGQNLEVWGRPQNGRSCIQIQLRARQPQDATRGVPCARTARAPHFAAICALALLRMCYLLVPHAPPPHPCHGPRPGTAVPGAAWRPSSVLMLTWWWWLATGLESGAKDCLMTPLHAAAAA
jgi:hypothetical protein